MADDLVIYLIRDLIDNICFLNTRELYLNRYYLDKVLSKINNNSSYNDIVLAINSIDNDFYICDKIEMKRFLISSIFQKFNN